MSDVSSCLTFCRPFQSLLIFQLFWEFSSIVIATFQPILIFVTLGLLLPPCRHLLPLGAYVSFLVYEHFPSLWHSSLHWPSSSLALSSFAFTSCVCCFYCYSFSSILFLPLLNITCGLYFYGQRHVSFCVFVLLLYSSSSSTSLLPGLYVVWALSVSLRCRISRASWYPGL